jgi:hypothetical protein
VVICISNLKHNPIATIDSHKPLQQNIIIYASEFFYIYFGDIHFSYILDEHKSYAKMGVKVLFYVINVRRYRRRNENG